MTSVSLQDTQPTMVTEHPIKAHSLSLSLSPSLSLSFCLSLSLFASLPLSALKCTNCGQLDHFGAEMN